MDEVGQAMSRDRSTVVTSVAITTRDARLLPLPTFGRIALGEPRTKTGDFIGRRGLKAGNGESHYVAALIQA